MTDINYTKAAREVTQLECGYREDLDDGTYVSVWICPDSDESECVVYNHCWSDSRIISTDNGRISDLSADTVESFRDEAARGMFS